MTSAVELQRSLAALNSIQLSNVSFGSFHAQLDFSGEFNVSLRIDKNIEQLTEDGLIEIINIETKQNYGSVGKLVALIGGKVRSVEYLGDSLRVEFEKPMNETIVIQLASTDFDPVQISCVHHMKPRELVWDYVVNAKM